MAGSFPSPILAALALGASLGSAALPARAEERLTVHSPGTTLAGKIELSTGFTRDPWGQAELPVGAFLMLEASNPTRDAGGSASLAFDAAPFVGDTDATLTGLEVYRRGRRADLRVGRLDLVQGGRFLFVDGGDLRVRLARRLVLGAWGGTAWHPEAPSIASGGPVWGLDLCHRSFGSLGGGMRYQHSSSEDGSGLERIGFDLSLYRPEVAGAGIEGRLDVVPLEGLLELGALAGEVRPHHRVHLRVEAGRSEPRLDSLPRGGSVYAALVDGPSWYLDGRGRVALAPFVLALDLGGLAQVGDEGPEPGLRAALGASTHLGKPWRLTGRLSGLAGPGGVAGMTLAELGHAFGPLDISVLGEQAVYRYPEGAWNPATHVGSRVGWQAWRLLDLALIGQLGVGGPSAHEDVLMLVVTQRLEHGRSAGPAPQSSRFLSPWSPFHWQRDELPRSPGAVPGADPYPSLPTELP